MTWKGVKYAKTDLLAPEKYNITSAIEQYATDATKKQLFTEIQNMIILK